MNIPYYNSFINIFKNNSFQIQNFVKIPHSLQFVENFSEPYKLAMPASKQQLRPLFHENLPFSNLDQNKRIVGVEGNLIDEFCKLTDTNYSIDTGDYYNLIINKTQFINDFSLYRRLIPNTELLTSILMINDLGASQCALVPRNILAHLPFLSPYDLTVNIIFGFSIICVAAAWKLLKFAQNQRLSILNSQLEISRTLLGLTIDDNSWMRWTLKENILLIPFIYMMIILMGIYQSYISSEIISAPPMESVKSIHELNMSNTKIYEYYKEYNRFRPENVVNLKSFVDTQLSIFPEQFDENLAYFVRCRFAEEFVESQKNFIGDRQIFNMIEDHDAEAYYSTYIVNENFPLKTQFMFFVKALDEAGIIDYWTKIVIQENFDKYRVNDEQKPIVLNKIFAPVFVLITGLCVSFVVFGIELGIFLIFKKGDNRVEALEMGEMRINMSTKEAMRVSGLRRHSV